MGVRGDCGDEMKLETVLDQLETFDDESLIFARRDSKLDPDSEAIVILCPEDESQPHEPEGMEYLLEVFLAREVLEVWSDWRGGRMPGPNEKIAALEYYCEHDCYIPIEEES